MVEGVRCGVGRVINGALRKTDVIGVFIKVQRGAGVQRIIPLVIVGEGRAVNLHCFRTGIVEVHLQQVAAVAVGFHAQRLSINEIHQLVTGLRVGGGQRGGGCGRLGMLRRHGGRGLNGGSVCFADVGGQRDGRRHIDGLAGAERFNNAFALCHQVQEFPLSVDIWGDQRVVEFHRHNHAVIRAAGILIGFAAGIAASAQVRRKIDKIGGQRVFIQVAGGTDGHPEITLFSDDGCVIALNGQGAGPGSVCNGRQAGFILKGGGEGDHFVNGGMSSAIGVRDHAIHRRPAV